MAAQCAATCDTRNVSWASRRAHKKYKFLLQPTERMLRWVRPQWFLFTVLPNIDDVNTYLRVYRACVYLNGWSQNKAHTNRRRERGGGAEALNAYLWLLLFYVHIHICLACSDDGDAGDVMAMMGKCDNIARIHSALSPPSQQAWILLLCTNYEFEWMNAVVALVVEEMFMHAFRTADALSPTAR